MTQREDVLKFEQGRIKALQEERLHIQKKTFTKWMNSFLQKVRMEVDDLFMDLADGRKLLKLLEIISGEKLGKPNNGRMRVHKVENVNKSLAFLHTKVRLESIGAEDIVDGNPRLILGLIWTIILRFQIQEIEIDVDEENESSEKKSAKDALLLWCQRRTNGYKGVNIQDFTGSWRNGLAFNALIHAHRPDLLDYTSLEKNSNIDNLNIAFDVANNELGIPRLLDAEDVDTNRPDEKSVITYVASYYHTFARMKNEMKSGRRIANILGQLMDTDKKKILYEQLTSDLLEWIQMKIKELENHEFPNSLEGIQRELLAFKKYRTVEKPPKYIERSEIEALYFHINTLLKSLNQGVFIPQEGQLIHDLERNWESLERAEHQREVALREELLRQERLEQLNYKFEKKSVLRDGYLREMIQVLNDPRFGNSLTQVDATVKKHEAISADIMAREERFHDLNAMSEELIKENYHGTQRVKKREEEVLQRWKDLLKLLENRKINLNNISTIFAMLREIETVMTTIKEIEANYKSEDVGPHLLVVEDLLQKQNLTEMQTTAIGETVRRLTRQGQQHIQSKQKDAALLKENLNQLNSTYDRLTELSKERRLRLEEARNFFQFIEDHEDEEAWLIEKQRICKADISAKDLIGVMSLQQKHKALLDEMKVHRQKSNQICKTGLTINSKELKEIQSRVDSLQSHWSTLSTLSQLRTKQLQDAAEAYQFYADANEAESWLHERLTVLSSTDHGVDEPSAQALLARNKILEEELDAYQGDIQSLNTQGENLIKAGISNILLPNETPTKPLIEPIEEWVFETRLLPQEVLEEEIIEHIEHRTVVEERQVPQVKSLYPFSGQGMTMTKGEVMFLLNKTNPDWWSVRKLNGTDGFVPANYVCEIEPKIMQVSVRRPHVVKTTKKIPKVKMVKQKVRVKKTRTPEKYEPKKNNINPNNEDTIDKRIKKINETYKKSQDLAKKRHALLEDSICLYGFYRECDDFEKWIKDKEKLLKTDDKLDTVESAKRKYEKFLTDLSASHKRVEDIDKAVQDFAKLGHSQLNMITKRQNQIKKLWDNLNWLKSQKEKSLEGALSVELFEKTCNEAKDWMTEKMDKLDSAEVGLDLKTIQALQRRHLNLERELAPVEEKVNRVHLLANSVKSSYPDEKENVNQRQNDVQILWQNVKNKALARRSRLENAVGQQIFMNSSKNLLNWLSSVKEIINADSPARDVVTAENLLKNHNELGDDIKAHQDEIKEVTLLGKQLLSSGNCSSNEVKERNDKLKAEVKNVMDEWSQKKEWNKQCLALQVFNKEADHIDAATSGSEMFLDYTDLGGSIDDVEALLKRHEDFENSLYAQDDRLKTFCEMANKLVSTDHYDKNHIEKRKDAVLNRRNLVKDQAAARRNALIASRNYQAFCADVDDLKTWLNDKLKTASDESYRDLTNIERKLQKHEAFECELRANEGQLRNINKCGHSLINEENYRKKEVQKMLRDLNNDWKKLVDVSVAKGRCLRQAAAQHTYNRTLDDAHFKYEELKSNLKSQEVGKDLRHCKQLLKNHQVSESEIHHWKHKINDLVQAGDEMAQDGHFDAENILQSSKNCQQMFDGLSEPLKLRKEALDESLRFHKFGFELEAELGWIREHLPLVESVELGTNLHQAQTLHKKHKKLEAEIQGHQSLINKTIETGQALIHQKHPETKQVSSLCTGLEDAWQDLLTKSEDRNRKLELNLKAQQFFFEASEIESWLIEKNNILSSTDCGRDRDAASKLLTKHKALELELDTYEGIVKEMCHTGNTMVNLKHPDIKAITAKQQYICEQFKQLQKFSTARQHNLVESMCRHEFLIESYELELWIKDYIQAASSEDYGQDFEHLLVLQNKFDDLKHRVETGLSRFNQCEDLANKLIANDSEYTPEIEKRQEEVRELWQQLIITLENRDKRLKAAGEIHRFHRDVADALSRISDKDATISDDLGRDLNSVLTLIRKHEGFENDLVALEAQLQILVEDAVKLQTLYPGSNAAHIAKQQETVIRSWTSLQNRSAHRREALQASCDLQRFLAQVRDLVNWSSSLRATTRTEEKVRDAASAQLLKGEHEAVKAEIEAREETFQTVAELGEALVQGGHFRANEIQEKLNHLLEERHQLHTSWHHKKVHLDQLIDLQFFLRDAKQIDTICNTQEVALANLDYGNTVDQVASLVKKHEGFEKLFETQEEKIALLKEHCDKLLNQNHFESDLISRRLNEVLARRAHIRKLSVLRKQKLDDALLHTQFLRDVDEAESWINEKRKKLDVEISKGDVNNLEDKIKKLQKHQAFQAELSANQGRINTIKQNADMLIEKKHKNSKDIQDSLSKLLVLWRNLLQETNEKGRGLEEAQDILEFNNQVDKVETWIRDKEMMVQAGEMGLDYEHCLALQKKLEDIDNRVDESKIQSINNLTDKLIRQGRSDTQSIQQRRQNLNNKWKALQGALSEYREHLNGALEIHSFNRDVDDTLQRVSEKALAMSSNETGKNLGSVQQLQRKQDALERDMTAIEGKTKEHELECRRLIQKYPDMSTPIKAKLSEIQNNWRNLHMLSKKRRDNLNEAYIREKFLSELKEAELWVLDSIKKIKAHDMPATIAEAKALLELNQERKAEINGRQEHFKTLKDSGLKINPIPEKELAHLDELRRTLSAAWEERRMILSQALELQIFRNQADQVDNWLASKDAFLRNDDLGESLSSVEELIRKHEAFEKTLSAQLVKVEELEKYALELVTGQHYDSQGIQNRLKGICSRRERLKEATASRKKRLNDSRLLQQFLRNMYEVEGWIIQKQQVAGDENYRDSTNLQRKIQKHATFDSELSANRARVNTICTEGENLISSGHFASMEIRARLDELETKWRNLQDTSVLKKQRLQDAYQALLFNRTLEELEAWTEEVEMQLQSEDHGKDLQSVVNLLKRHSLLENDVHSHGEACQSLKDTAMTFQNSNHFMKEEIQEKAAIVLKRYYSLQEPMQIRRDNLEDALIHYRLLRDIEEEMAWIGDKELLIGSNDFGTSLHSVQALQNKHQALEAELISHEPVVTSLVDRGQQMVRSGHFAAQQIEANYTILQEKMAKLKEDSKIRKQKLFDAYESQMFYAEANETEVWLKEKYPLLASNDYGRDEDSVLLLMKKLEGIERELTTFQHTLERLAKLGRDLVSRSHFDSENILQKQTDIEEVYTELCTLNKKRATRLVESRKFYKFIREAEDVAEWIGDQTTVAASEDYGRDVEHVELLIQAFDSFLSGLNGSEGRISSCIEVGRKLLEENNPERDQIRIRLDDTQQLWDDLKELANARQEALMGAKQVHVFDRTADETISWIQEKDALLAAEDYGHDLDTIQTLIQKHQGFEADLAAVKEQVECVVQEAGRLSAMFPDAKDHIEVKQEEAVDAWATLLEDASQRKNKLNQAEHLQSYFDQYRHLIAWINETIAKVTSPTLSQDVNGAEMLILRHQEYNAEITSRSEAIAEFYNTGKLLIQQGHFMSDEIKEKINILEQRHYLLTDTWKKRKILYDQNLDTQLFKRDADLLETWIQSRESVLNDEKIGDSIWQVEELIRKHEDFEKTIEAQEDKFNTLNRITMLESAFKKQLELEEKARLAEKERIEREKLEARKQREVQRITDERKREGDRWKVNSGGETINGDDDQFDPNMRLMTPGSPAMSTSSTFSSIFGNRLKKDVKRAESMKADSFKKPKRTPSFTTRRRTQSFRKLQKLENLDQLPPVEIQGFLDRKHELQSSGKKAAVRSWKTFYTVLCGQLLCFFKDQEDFVASKAATSPIIVFKAKCEKAFDYTKRKHVFRLCCTDGSEFLFLADTANEMEEWVNKITFHAQLPPSLQLLSYDENQKSSPQPEKIPVPSAVISTSSSAATTPEVERKPLPTTITTRKDNQIRRPIPVRPPSIDNIPFQNNHSTDTTDYASKILPPGNNSTRPHSYYTNGNNDWNKDGQNLKSPDATPPPLPLTAPPIKAGNRDTWTSDYRHSAVYANVDVLKQQPPIIPNRSATLPSLNQHRASESSSESEHQSPIGRKDKRSSVLSSLFRKKKATHL
ncbi:spectrin beta chain, non-erythrocytic 5 isoform X2 [Daktulosphaira vitifoliae]|uniref:spectrin beta chain, non-erythrocytic 5 isoform X2 n=1 Tax=Daktulosphaira vitifoliae TaxID=58002 RepID=UPI0021AA8884|nr:spectrin beta chain, non-erythrocytic 5 isoform X2 [Daktulosphaira vitifoliae]